jgi:hypothetical protein
MAKSYQLRDNGVKAMRLTHYAERVCNEAPLRFEYFTSLIEYHSSYVTEAKIKSAL